MWARSGVAPSKGFSCWVAVSLLGCTPTAADVSADTDTDSGSTASPVAFTCPDDVQGVVGVTVDDSRIKEASGLVASVAWPGGWWTHNDSGDTARVFYVDASGAVTAEVGLDGVTARDFEDIARRSLLHDEELVVGDIGDNGRRRGDVTLYLFIAPAPATGAVQSAESRTVTLPYADGVPHDAEALAIDPVDGATYVVTKELSATATVFRADSVEQGTPPLDVVGTLDFDTPPLKGGFALVTAADFSPDGRWFALRTYTTAFVWHRDDTTPLSEVLDQDPCVVDLILEPQGETLALDATGFTTLSEGPGQPLIRYDLMGDPQASATSR